MLMDTIATGVLLWILIAFGSLTGLLVVALAGKFAMRLLQRRP